MIWTYHYSPQKIYIYFKYCNFSGYMDRALFKSWFEQVFIPNCGQRRPVLLMLDNHDSHISISVIDKARENEVCNRLYKLMNKD